ncbi:MAG: hypothetical protein HC835_21835 [Oscillatoriales cyanobacterium RM2_1_1]|nr:hypothetical protein [Oscillatoriales cyanobacterium SM2_3_0]NJO48020.1 hypothetical protein [Oscillatoriales cyanobacterium RM2_1_1]
MKLFHTLALALSASVIATTSAQACIFQSGYKSTVSNLDAPKSSLTVPVQISVKTARMGGFGVAAAGFLGLGGVYLSRRFAQGSQVTEAAFEAFQPQEHPEAPGGELDLAGEVRELITK